MIYQMQNEDLEKLYKDFPKKKLWGKRLFNNASQPQKEVEGAGSPRLPDEIRGSGRRRGRLEQVQQTLPEKKSKELEE